MIIVLELVLVALSVQMADALQARVKVIPPFIVYLPEVDYTPNDLLIVIQYFLIVHLVIFVIGQWRKGPWILHDAKRTAHEVLALAVAFTISTLGLFVTTSVAFDPHLIAGIGISSGCLFLFTHLFATIVKGTPPLSAMGQLCVALGRRLFSVTGLLVILFSISPAILATLFVSDRDVANVITQIRIYLSDSRSFDYSLVNALGVQRFHQPILAKTTTGEPGRLYILERRGRLLSVPYPGGGAIRVALDIREKVGTAEIENGALGFAFHPEFGNAQSKQKGYVYVYYTDVS